MILGTASAVGSGTLVITGGTLQASTAVALANAVALKTAGAVTVSGSNSLTFNGGISGTGSLILADSGGVTDGAANTYTGTTTVNAGTLKLNEANANARWPARWSSTAALSCS